MDLFRGPCLRPQRRPLTPTAPKGVSKKWSGPALLEPLSVVPPAPFPTTRWLVARSGTFATRHRLALRRRRRIGPRANKLLRVPRRPIRLLSSGPRLRVHWRPHPAPPPDTFRLRSPSGTPCTPAYSAPFSKTSREPSRRPGSGFFGD